MSVLLEIAGVGCLILLNGLFVAAEFAIVKVRSTQIEPLLKSGHSRAMLVQHVINHLDRYISTTQLGITVTNLALGWLGEPLVAGLIEPVMGAVGFTGKAAVGTVALVLAFAVITFLQIVIGELAPKHLAIRRPQRIALALSAPLNAFYLLFRPFIWLLNVSATGFLRLLGMQPAREGDIGHSEEELRLLLGKGKIFSSTGKNILLNAMEMHKRSVREIMVPRTGVVFLSTGKTLEENVALALESQFTRFPLCEGDLDNVLGMVHIKDLFKLKDLHGSGSRLLEVRRDVPFVPETTPLEKILNTFLGKRVLMAIAVDEYGGTAGLVTLENVLEELVGEIRDEFDVEQLPVQKLSDNEFLVDGGMPLHDFAKMFDVEPDSKDMVTVSGYAIHLLGRVPEKGVQLPIGRWMGTVESVDGRRVKTLRLKKIPVEDEQHA